jgi:hypothetical protein
MIIWTETLGILAEHAPEMTVRDVVDSIEVIATIAGIVKDERCRVDEGDEALSFSESMTVADFVRLAKGLRRALQQLEEVPT